jgi:hypothetical protein
MAVHYAPPPNQCSARPALPGALLSKLIPCFSKQHGASSDSGTELAVPWGVKTKLSLPIAIVLGVLAPFAFPAGADAVACAVALLGDLHIAELAVVGNALTTVF